MSRIWSYGHMVIPSSSPSYHHMKKSKSNPSNPSTPSTPPSPASDNTLAKIINPSNLPFNYSPDQPKPKHLKSCLRCRKHKTKCNYIETAPNACSSCIKRGITCQLEIVIPVKRSNIIKNLSNDIQLLKNLVDDLIKRDNYLKSICSKRGIKINGLVDIKSCQNNNINYNDYYDESESDESDDSDNDYIYSKNNNRKINNILSKFDNITPNLITPPNSNSISPNLSDIDLDLNTKIYSLDDTCYFSSIQINQFIDDFNSNYLPFIPIINPIISIENLFISNKLLFWSIIFIITCNTDIYNKFILKEILNFINSNDNNIENLNPIISILLISSFPTKIKSSKFNFDDDQLDTCIFQWLEICKLKFSNSKIFKNLNLIDDSEIEINETENLKNLWCSIFILGNFYGFRLGLKWSQSIDFILNDIKTKDNYLSKILNISILLSNLLDKFVFNNLNFQSNNNDDLLLFKSISNWKFNFNNFKKNSFNNNIGNENQINLLNLSFDFLELIFILFEPLNSNSNLNSQIDKIFKIISNFNSNLNLINSIIKFPIFLKISIEFICLILTKLSYNPYFLINYSNSNLIIYINLFNKLISFVEFNDTRFVFNTLMDFDSSIKFDSSLFDIFNLKNFKKNLIPGLINDLKFLNLKFNSINLNDSNRFLKIKSKFEINNSLNFDNYLSNFNNFRSQVDLVIIYSNEILKVSNNDNNSTTTNTIDSKQLISDDIDLFRNINWIN
ncbi:hypothetical protein C6P42_003659 [Pichia californica]|nr:hypothetical protein C6P42_003659 [[Candida] californica]